MVIMMMFMIIMIISFKRKLITRKNHSSTVLQGVFVLAINWNASNNESYVHAVK